jgi:integrase
MIGPEDQFSLKKYARGSGDCRECAGVRKVLYQALSKDLLFAEAFSIWLSHRLIETNGLRTKASYLAGKTERDYRVCAKALAAFFGDWPIDRIDPGHIMTYQNARAVNPRDTEGKWRCVRNAVVRGLWDTREEAEAWSAKNGADHEIIQTLWAYPAGANCIRKEVALLVRILKAARLWGDEDELRDAGFQRLRPVEPEIERAMTIEEQHRFLHTAGSREKFQYIYWYSIVALQTTASTNELRALRICDVLLEDRIIQVPRAGSKNPYRQRAIPLVTDDAIWALEHLIARAKSLGACSPTHFLFPRQGARTHYDPTHPMSESGLKKPWDAVRKAAGLPQLRLYDLRHTGITRMAEAGVPLAVAMTFAGHMTEQMQRRYTSICMAAQRGWGEQVWSGVQRVPGSQPWAATSPASQAWPKRKPVAADRLTAPVRGSVR